jgi:hypothetical protein
MVGENVTTNASYIGWVDDKHGSNLLYDILYSEGCVFYARTTQPQTIMHLETSSNVYGVTVNPYNRTLTPGGSSGGESALVGMRGSLLVSTTSATFAPSDQNTESIRALVVILEAAFVVHVPMSAYMALSESNSPVIQLSAPLTCFTDQVLNAFLSLDRGPTWPARKPFSQLLDP